ncbi:MAG TPA: alpha/beta hydrolase [Conexibacter sp.]|nr:alpha/beta hydrolase [Conexibacter sp.]
MDVTDHTGELDGQPVFWRSATAEGTPTLYVHGVPTSSDDWLPFLALTGGLAPDLLGFGRSGKGGQNDYTPEGIAAFLERFLEMLGIERVQLVVHDWGSAALIFATRHPERVERLVIVNAVPLLPGYRWHWIARMWRRPGVGEFVMGLSFKLTARRILRPAFAGPVPKPFIRAAWRHFDQGTQRAILRLYRSAPESRLAELGRELSRIDARTLVVWGALDPFIPPRFAEEYAARIPGARVELVPQAGHWPWLDRADLIRRIADFLGEN